MITSIDIQRHIHIVGMGEMGQKIAELVHAAGFLLSGFDLEKQLCVDCDGESHIQTISHSDIIIVTTPSFAIKKTIPMIVEAKKQGTRVYVISKGVIGDTQQSVAEYVVSHLKNDAVLVYGPMITEEITVGSIACGVTLGGLHVKKDDIDFWNVLGFVCDTSNDIRGVGILSMIKNTYAIVLGCLREQGVATNTIARVYAEMLAEARTVVQSCGGYIKSVDLYAGVGDMLATGLSEGSSNGAWGGYVAKHGALPTDFYAEGVRAGKALARRIPEYVQAPWLHIGMLLGCDAKIGLQALQDKLTPRKISSMIVSNKKPYYLVLDIGTSGIKALLFKENGGVVHKVYQTIDRIFPNEEWVEQDPMMFVRVSKKVMQDVVTEAGVSVHEIESVGITTQRETIIVWDKHTGKPLYNALVWQDQRTKQWCNQLAQTHNDFVRKTTGLFVTPYFSASKLAWLLQNVEDVTRAYEFGNVMVGTVDTWMIWNMTQDRRYVTDATNAHRTLLCDIHSRAWSRDLGNIFGIDTNIMANIQSVQSDFGMLDAQWLGVVVPIKAVVGDQQSSLYAVGQEEGNVKITGGSGAFVMQILNKEETDFMADDEWFYTVSAHNNIHHIAAEKSIMRLAEYVTPVLDDPEALSNIMQKAAHNIADGLAVLPQTPSKVIIDGGVSQNNEFVNTIKQLSGLDIRRQVMYDGTALGTFLLLRDQK